MTSSLPWWAGAIALIVVGACTYDFEAPFAETPVGGSAPGGSGGEGGTNTSTSSSTSGTGGQGGGEQCGNGADDDDDDLVDCADPDCADYSCVEPPPAGWALAAFLLVQPGDSLSDCEAAWPTGTDAFVDLEADPAQCDCSCANPTVTCTLEDTRYFDSHYCGPALIVTLSPGANGACELLSEINGSDSTDGIRGLAVDVQGGSCAPVAGDHALPEPGWLANGRLCAGPSVGAGCDDGAVCVPPTAAPFGLCVTRDGNEDCPAPYTDKTLLHADYDDGRGCDCSCGSMTGASCTAVTEIWQGTNSCQGSPVAAVPHGGSCTVHAGPVSAGSFRYTATPSGGSCASQGQPTGQLTPTAPLTVCCLP